MRTLRRSLFALAACTAPAPLALAQTAGGPPQVTWRPRIPLQGSLVVLAVRPPPPPPPPPGDSVLQVRGELAGEPLHFEWIAGWYRALAAVPLDAGDSVTAHLVVEHAGGATDTLTPKLPVGRRRVRRERLHAAPELVEPPESVSARIDAERELVRDVKARAHETPRLWRARFVRPRPSSVTDGFGVGRIFNGVVQSRHLGVDFAGSPGAPVRATNRGVVAFVGDLYFSGTTIYLDHGAGLVTAYLHLSRALVTPGDTVAPGQVIGQVGASGRVTGPHLHWLATYGRIAVDPLDLLRVDLDVTGKRVIRPP